MLVVVGGHSRNIGKTSVVCGIIRSLREFHWTAIKITQYGHGVCAHEGEACGCADPRHPVAMSQERGNKPLTDSGRFLEAGADRAFWLRTPSGRLGEGLPHLRRAMQGSENWIVESNSLLQFRRPELCLIVVDGKVGDFKPTSRRFLDRADALVVTSDAPLIWEGLPESLFADKPQFEALAPAYESEDLIETVRAAAERTTMNRNGLAENLQL
jgi:hypothetical protein